MRTQIFFRLLVVMFIVVLPLSACGKNSASEVQVSLGELRVVPTEAAPGQVVLVYIDKIETNTDVKYEWSVNQGEIVSGQDTSAIQYQVPNESGTSLITVKVSADSFYQEMSTTVTVVASSTTATPSSLSLTLSPPTCSSSMISTYLSPYNGNVPNASGTVDYCQSPDGNFVASIEIPGLPADGSYVFTLQAADGEAQTNSLLAQVCADRTDMGDHYCDIPLDAVNSAGVLQSQFSYELKPGDYNFKFLLKDITNNYQTVMNNDSVPLITITKSLGFQKGITYVSWLAGQFNSDDADQALEELAATGANWIALVVTRYQDNANSKEIKIDSLKTPTDDDIRHVINKARQLGLSVMLKPHIDLSDGDWRGNIGSSFDGVAWSSWFTAYRDFIVHYADIAAQNQDTVKILCVGTELKATSSQEADWRQVLQDVRKVYSGKLVYASNWDEPSRGWWKELDYIGVDAYFKLETTSTSPTVEELKTAWQPSIIKLEDLHTQIGIPIILTELGYRSITDAHAEPYNYEKEAPVDLNEQANLYQAAFEVLLDKDWLVGIYWWNWLTDPNQGGTQDTDYTPHGKPAEDVVKKYYLTTRAPLALYSGPTACSPIPGASGEVLFSKETKGVFQATITLSNLTPKHVYVFTLNCKSNDSNCRKLLANFNKCSGDSGGYCDIQTLGATDATGSLKKNIEFNLPTGQYDMKFLIKDPSADSCNLLFNDNPGSFTILNP
jgi:hypothetical protein